MRDHLLVTLPERAVADLKVVLAVAIAMLVCLALYDKWPRWRR